MSHAAGTTSVVAVGHVESAWNLVSRLQGHRDVSLNETGRLQAGRVAQALADERTDSVDSSDLAHATPDETSDTTP